VFLVPKCTAQQTFRHQRLLAYGVAEYRNVIDKRGKIIKWRGAFPNNLGSLIP